MLAFRHAVAGNQCRVRWQTEHTDSMTGTSMSTPTTVANAAPSAIAVATASAKKCCESLACFSKARSAPATPHETLKKASRHLASLREAGLVETPRQGLWVRYRLAELTNPRLPSMAGAVRQTLARLEVVQRDAARLRECGSSCAPEPITCLRSASAEYSDARYMWRRVGGTCVHWGFRAALQFDSHACHQNVGTESLRRFPRNIGQLLR